MKIIEYDAECHACKGSGLFIGMAERDGIAVQCHRCKGTGCVNVHIEYAPFTERKPRENVKRVIQHNPGYVVGEYTKEDGEVVSLKDYGGLPVEEWEEGKPFGRGTEMRKHACPAWWYQSADYTKKPEWEECIVIGAFSACCLFESKGECWKRWDKDNPDNE